MHDAFELPVEDDATLERRFERVFGRKMTTIEREWLFVYDAHLIALQQGQEAPPRVPPETARNRVSVSS